MNAACTLCAAPLPGGERLFMHGRPVCSLCVRQVAQEVGAAAWAPAALLGLAGALAGAALWAGIVAWTRWEVAYVAIAIGFLAGHGVRLGAGTGRGPALQRLAAVLAGVGLVAAKYLVFALYVREKTGGAVGPLDLEVAAAFPAVLPRMVGLFDLLWVFLAVVTAHRIPAAPMLVVARARAPEPAPEPPAGAAAPAGARRSGIVAAVATGALLMLTKGKAILAALKLGPLLTTGWTMLLAVGVYASVFGWRFAAGLVTLILVHELGHGVAAWQVGLPVGAPVFIPFVGAFIALKDRPKSTWQDFVIAAGGPLAGTAGGLVCLGLAAQSADPGRGLLLALAFFALVMNLFNLTPVWQLDGHRMIGAVPPPVRLAGLVVAAVVLVVASDAGRRMNPVALIAVLVGLWQAGHALWHARGAAAATLLDRLEAHAAAAAAVPDAIPAWQRAVAAATYFGLLAVLVAGVHRLDHVLYAAR